MRSLCLALTMIEVAVVIARPSIGLAGSLKSLYGLSLLQIISALGVIVVTVESCLRPAAICLWQDLCITHGMRV